MNVVAVFSIVAVVAALLPALAWLFFFYRRDRLEPEPKRLIGSLFLRGALIAFPLYFLVEQFATSPETRVGEGEELISGVVATLLVFGTFVAQEGIKLAVGADRTRRDPELSERVDGMLYLTSVGLGFGWAETTVTTIRTFAETFQDPEAVALAAESAALLIALSAVGALLSDFVHAVLAGIVGYFFAAYILDRRSPLLIGAAILGVAALRIGMGYAGQLSPILVLAPLGLAAVIYAYLFLQAMASSPHRGGALRRGAGTSP